MSAPWEDFQPAQESGPWGDFTPAEKPSKPLKIGKEGFADALREVLKGTDWGTRNIAGAGSAVVNAAEGLKGLVGQTNPDQVAAQKIIAEEAPIGNIAGNMALAAPTALIPGANTVTGAAVIGAIYNALTTPGDATERAKAAAAGGIGSALGAGLAKYAAGRAPIRPNADAELLAKEGISLTPGQNAGGVLKNWEDKATSMPFVGNVIQNARLRGIQDFDKAALNRALEPIGQQADDVGRAGFKSTKQAISDAYDTVLPKLNNIHQDPQFVDDMAQLKQLAGTMPKDKADQFNKILDYYVDSRFTPAGRMSGETMKQVESDLGRESIGYRGSPIPDDRKLGDALRQAQENLRQMVKRTNPQNADDLQKVNEAFSNYAILRKAASMTGTAKNDGLFTPAQLNNAVRAADKSAGKARYASGTAKMQDLTDPAMRVMPSSVPDSGTSGRLMADLTNPFNWPGLATKGALALPLMAAYSRPGAAAINATVNNGVLPLSELVRASIGNSPNTSRIGTMTLAELMRQQGL